MLDAKRLLDQFMGANSQNMPANRGGFPQQQSGGQGGGIGDMVGGLGNVLGGNLGGIGGGAVAGGLAALLMGSKSGRKMAGNALQLGGMAVVGALAYKAYQNQQATKGGAAAVSGTTAAPGSQPNEAVAQSALSLPETSRFHPVSQTEDDALLFLRTMVAAAAADGHIDQAERSRIVKGLTEAGIDFREATAELIEVPNKPGALLAQLERLAKKGVNLRSICATSGRTARSSVVVWTSH